VSRPTLDPTRPEAVRYVDPGSAGDAAGLRAGDVIVDVDGVPIATAAELTALVQRVDEGCVRVGYQREGKRLRTPCLLRRSPQ